MPKPFVDINDPYRVNEFFIGDKVKITGPHPWHVGLEGTVCVKTTRQSGVHSYEVNTGPENIGYIYFADCLELKND